MKSYLTFSYFLATYFKILHKISKYNKSKEIAKFNRNIRNKDIEK